LLKCIDDLDAFIGIHAHSQAYDPLVLSYLVHYQFEAIHPFTDGNGRIGRLLLALSTFDWCKLHMPWLYMSAYFERHKDEYMDNMFGVSTHGDWDRWIEFCLRGTVEQCQDAIRRCDALNALHLEMHHALDAQPRMGALVNSMFIHPVFTATEIAKWGRTSLPTARRDIEDLVAAGYVKYVVGDRPKYYCVPRIFQAAYWETAPNVLEQPEQSEPVSNEA
jgi:Fic family protein